MKSILDLIRQGLADGTVTVTGAAADELLPKLEAAVQRQQVRIRGTLTLDITVDVDPETKP